MLAAAGRAACSRQEQLQRSSTESNLCPPLLQELYGRLSTPDTRIELAFDVDKSRLAVSLGFDV